MCNVDLRERKTLWSFLLLILAVLAIASSMAAARNRLPVAGEIPTPPADTRIIQQYVSHQLVVCMTSTSTAASLSVPDEVYSVQTMLGHSPVYLLTLEPNADEAGFAAMLNQWPTVIWAHPNYVTSTLHPIQGSYPFPDQNHVGNMVTQYAATMLDLPAAQAAATGSGVTIGVIDAGISFANPALGGKAESGFDFVDNDMDASDLPGGIASGHGTFVAGVAHLTAPGAVLRSYRVIDQDGFGDGFTLARAIEAAVDDGCDVINISLALTNRHLAVRDAIDYAASQGVTVVAGAGNNGAALPVYPAAEDNAMSVASVDSALHATPFTNFGSHVDVCAPGSDIYSSYLDPDYAWWSGTSFSSAFTSGLAALLKEAHPTAYGFQIRGMILSGATDIDSANPQRSGGLGAGLINPVASLNSAMSADTAVFFPGSMQFDYYVCSQNPDGLHQTGFLVSTNAPAAYTSEIIPSGGVTFASVDAPSGMTGDSVTILVDPSGLAPGTYRNGVTFYVEGVAEAVWLPVQLDVYACDDTLGGALVSPSEIWINATTGSEVVYYRTATLTSSNAPAPFHAEIESTPGIFTQLINSDGVTNDSVRFTVNPAWMLSAGQYTNTINYYVEGITTPASLTIHLAISDSVDPGEDAWVQPEFPNYVATAGTTVNLWGSITVGAWGAPKPFHVAILDDADFVDLTDSLGMTNDSAIFWVVVTPALSPGVYVDTLIAYVTGAPNSPVISVVSLTIDTSTAGGDTAVVIPARQTFYAPGGIPTQTTGSFIVHASGPSKHFTVSYLDSPDFTSLNISSGSTGNGVSFDIEPTSTLPGVYVDTLVVTVTGVTNNPLYVINTLIIESGTSNTAAVTPNLIIVNAVVGSPAVIRQALVTSSNAPTWFVADVYDDFSTFVTLPDTLGMTNDSITVVIHPEGLVADYYVDTVMIHVYGVAVPVRLTVELHLAAAAVAEFEAELELWNYPNPFNPSTEIGFILPATTQVRLDIYNILGQRVTTLIDAPMSAGEHSVSWDGRNASSGVYYYRLVAGSASQTRKMLLVK